MAIRVDNGEPPEANSYTYSHTVKGDDVILIVGTNVPKITTPYEITGVYYDGIRYREVKLPWWKRWLERRRVRLWVRTLQEGVKE